MSVVGAIDSEMGAAPAAGEFEGRSALTSYEAEQVRAIAAWKSAPPHPLGELFKRLTQPGARWIERVLPDSLMKAVIDQAYAAAEIAAAGVAPAEHPLEDSDKQAERAGSLACTIALAEGAVTGAGGVLTTLADVPLLFVLSLRTIVKIGRCYTYPLVQERDRKFVLGVLIAATSGSLKVRLDRLGQLHGIEEWFLQETQEEILTEEAASLLFQLEVFEGVPAVGAISGGLLNLLFMRRVEVTARHVFQERWLREHGKVDVIAPAEAHPRVHARGWGGAFGRAAHAAFYSLGFAAALPVGIVAALMGAQQSHVPGPAPA